MTYVEDALINLGNYRVLRVQQVAGQGDPDGISGALLLALGLRESGLKNINNAAKTDKGWIQISDTYHHDWLKQQEGCSEGSWHSVEGHNASEPDYCPRFSPALFYAISLLHSGQAYAKNHQVPAKDIVRFAVASYNAGTYNALRGYKIGDVDKYTTGGDYSAWVLEKKPEIVHWIDQHIHWKA